MAKRNTLHVGGRNFNSSVFFANYCKKKRLYCTLRIIYPRLHTSLERKVMVEKNNALQKEAYKSYFSNSVKSLQECLLDYYEEQKKKSEEWLKWLGIRNSFPPCIEFHTTVICATPTNVNFVQSARIAHVARHCNRFFQTFPFSMLFHSLFLFRFSLSSGLLTTNYSIFVSLFFILSSNLPSVT